MISYIELENFKSFKNIKFDLTGLHQSAKNLAFIYGENGSGKSNLVDAFVVLRDLMDTINISRKMTTIMNALESDERSEQEDREVLHFLRQQIGAQSIKSLYEENKRVGCQDPLSITVGIVIKGISATYKIKLLDGEVIEESLYGTIKKRKGTIFSVTKNKVILSSTVFTLKYKSVLNQLINQFWGTHSFFSILNEESKIKNKSFIEANISDTLTKLWRFLKSISTLTRAPIGIRITASSPIPIISLDKGKIELQDADLLQSWETAFRKIFCGLYSDVIDVYYDKNIIDNMQSYELKFKKVVDGEILEIPFSKESSGTKRILNIIPLLITAIEGGTVIIDEFDDGIHDLMIENILNLLKDELKGQIITTTHNTHLLKSLQPNSVYVIAVDYNGKKSINCLTDYENRPKKNNNLADQYLKGEYNGIPYVGYVDFLDVTEELIEKTFKY